MAGHSITVSGTIDASRERVWQVLTDLDNAPSTIPGITAIERLTEGSYAVGTRWRETRTMLGRTETHAMEVTEAIPHERTVVTAVTDGVRYTTTMQLSPAGTGTHLAITFGASQPDATLVQRLLWTAMGPIGTLFTRRMLNTELEEIRAAATKA
jgi:carbon monoxide dehydrogenase subunit G